MSALPSQVQPSFNKPGDVAIEKFEINGLSIMDSVGTGISGFQFFLHEDWLASFLTGHVILSDTKDAFRNFGLQGNDTVEVSWRSNKKNFPLVTFRGVIKNYTDYAIIRPGLHVFKGNVISHDEWNNSVKKISKAFSGSCEDIVQQVFKNELQSTEKLTVEETVSGQKHDIISPWWTPVQIINFMSGRAVGKTGGIGYHFFQNLNNGFFFVSPQWFADKNQKHTIKHIKYGLNNITEGNASIYSDYLNDLQLAENIGILQLLPSLDNVEHAVFGATVNTLDLTRKKFDSYDIASADYQKVQASDGFAQQFIKSNNVDLLNPEQDFYQPRFLIGQKYQSNSYMDNASAFRYADQYKVQKEIADQRFMGVRAKMTLYGISDLQIGDQIEFFMPVPNNSGSVTENMKHLFLRGTWMVSAVSHMFQGSRFYSNQVFIQRDSFESDKS